MDWPAHSWNVYRRNLGQFQRQGTQCCWPLASVTGAIPVLDLGRVRIAVTLRAKAAIRRGTSTSPAPGRESKMAKSGWALASCSICRSYSRIDSLRVASVRTAAHAAARPAVTTAKSVVGRHGRPHGFQARLILGFVRAPVLLEKLAQDGRFGFLQFLQRGPALQKIQRHGGVRILEPLQQLRIIRLEIGSQAIAKTRSFIDQLPAILRQKLQGTGLGGIWIQRPELVPMPDQHVQIQGCVRAIALGSRGPEDFAIVRRAGGMNGEQNQVLVFTQGEP